MDDNNTNEFRRGGYIIDTGEVLPCPLGEYHIYDENMIKFYNNLKELNMPWVDKNRCRVKTNRCYQARVVNSRPECIHKTTNLPGEEKSINYRSKIILNCDIRQYK